MILSLAENLEQFDEEAYLGQGVLQRLQKQNCLFKDFGLFILVTAEEDKPIQKRPQGIDLFDYSRAQRFELAIFDVWQIEDRFQQVEHESAEGTYQK